MRIIINASHLHIGGGLQHAISVINELKHIPENEYLIMASKEVLGQINQLEYKDNFIFHEITLPNNPFRIESFRLRKLLNKIHDSFTPSITLSIYGPTYWTPKSPHLMGYAIPHYVYPEYVKKIKFNLTEKIVLLLKKQIHRFFFKRNSQYYYTETKDVSARLSNFLNVNKENIYTVNNTYSHVFNQPIKNLNLLPARKDNQIRFLTVSAYYPHKNLEIINDVIPLLKEKNIDFIFVLTIPDSVFQKIFFKNKRYVLNLGPIELNSCPYLYENCDILFLPTLLEVFSASYPEAMAMSKPILTSNYSFAKSVCGDAAEYFDPLNPVDIVEKIEKIILNPERSKYIIDQGKERLKTFETSAGRAKKYLTICNQILKKNESKNK